MSCTIASSPVIVSEAVAEGIDKAADRVRAGDMMLEEGRGERDTRVALVAGEDADEGIERAGRLTASWRKVEGERQNENQKERGLPRADAEGMEGYLVGGEECT